jgi:Beta-propeller repeat
MRLYFQRLSTYAVSAVLILVVPAAVSAAVRRQVGAHHTPRHSSMSADPWLYVGGVNSNSVSIYDLAQPGYPKIGSITNGVSQPQGITIDGAGNVYVVGLAGSVTVYPPGGSNPSLTITNGLSNGDTVDCAVDTNGDVYVSVRGGPTPSIQVYAAGQTTPYRTITSPLIIAPSQLEFDSGRNLYFGDVRTGLNEIPFGSQTVQSLPYKRFKGTDGMALDPLNGNIAISTADTRHQVVHVYASGIKKPILTLKSESGADTVAIGAIGSVEYLFVPNSGTNSVNFYEHGSKIPASTLHTDVGYLVGVGYKPAGVP